MTGRGKVSPRDGTAVQEKGKLTAARIVEVARDVLANDGHAALTMRRVARQADLRLSHVQYYFSTKADLVRAILDAYLSASRGDMQGRLRAHNTDGDHALAPAVQELLAQHGSRHDCALFREMWAMAVRDKGIEELVARFYRHYQGEVAAALTGAVPGLSEARATRIALLVVATFEGLSVVRDTAARATPNPSLQLDMCRVIELLARDL